MLKKYREKRDFTKTPEPTGKKKPLNKKLQALTFVVQEHAATRLHFDFRLESNGVLLSWAVPKGHSLNPHEKRLAVMTEDHPLDYAGFEGIIPSGYGAGEVIVWDNGIYAPVDNDENPVDNRQQAEELIKKGLKVGKFSFYLEGKKLKGIWTLVRLKQKEKDWLLIKHQDKFAKKEGHPWKDKSVLSGQTLEDLQSEKKSPTKQKLEKKSKKQKTASVAVKTTSRKTPQKEQVKIHHKQATEKIVLPKNKIAKAFAIKNTRSNKARTSKGMSNLEDILADLNNKQENLELTIEGNKLTFSHLNKPFWPSYNRHKSITKRDYLRYLVAVSPWLLPHLKNRIITLVRFPQGIKGMKFFQRHWDEHLPKFVDTVKVYTEHEKRDQNFLMCNNLSTLLWLGQIADLEIHSMHTRIDPLPDGKKLGTKFTGSVKNVEDSLLNYPDYMVFDLDPYLYSGSENKGEEPELHRRGFKETCKIALSLKDLLDEWSVKSFVKTSGKTGLHIYIPIKRNVDYDKVREFSQTIGQYILQKHANKVTMDWSVAKRKGKVFFDHNMNARSKSLASIYSPRSSKEACVSTPVSWDELEKIYPTDFTIETILERLKQTGDLWSDILANKNNLLNLLNNKLINRPKKKPSSKLSSKLGSVKRSTKKN